MATMNKIDKNDPFFKLLSESLVDEVVGAVGLPKNRLSHWLTWRFFHKMTDPMASIGVTFERLVVEEGIPAASRWVLTLFCTPLDVHFEAEVPSEGPLLVAASHPGAYDALSYFSQLERNDIKWISTDIPFFRLLPHTSEHIIYASRKDSTSRMIAMRDIIRHLQAGGTMVYFPSGHRDADPAVFPGAEVAVDNWLNVFNTFYKYVPGLRVMPATASGILSEHWAYHWITKLRRKQIDKHRLAEFGQVITQMLNPGKLMITPSVSFGRAVSQEDLQREGANGDFQSAILTQARNLLRAHVKRFACPYL